MDAALLALLTETLTVAPYLSQDAYGKPTYGPSVTYAAREEWKIRRIVDQTGQERISRARVFFDGDVTLTLRDQVTLTDGTTPPILLLYHVRDLSGGTHHLEVSF